MKKKLIPCPDSVNQAGALLVKLRHALESTEEAARVGIETDDQIYDLFTETKNAIMAAIADTREHVPLRMTWGPGLVSFCEAEAAFDIEHRFLAFSLIMDAHNKFRLNLEACGIETPTNDSIARIIALGNWR